MIIYLNIQLISFKQRQYIYSFNLQTIRIIILQQRLANIYHLSPYLQLLAHIYVSVLTSACIVICLKMIMLLRKKCAEKNSIEQTPFTSVSSHDTHYSAESTEAMRIKCLAQGHSILMPGGLNRPSLYPEIDTSMSNPIY